MTTGLACTLVLSAQVAVGGLGLFDCLKKARHDYSGPECCGSCLSEHRTVQNLLVVLQHHASWKRRDDAAHALRKYDWRCHPDLVPALAHSLLNDCHEEVREEAAETLARLSPCDPTAHVALQQAALADPDPATRKRARKALDRLDRRCVADCSIRGAVPGVGPAVVASPVPVLLEVEAPPPSWAPRVYGEVPDDRVAPLLERTVPALPPGSYGPYPTEPGHSTPPDARPGLLPPALPPAGPPIEVLPPELPPPAPPAVSPFGASGRPAEPPRRAGSVRLFTVGRPR